MSSVTRANLTKQSLPGLLESSQSEAALLGGRNQQVKANSQIRQITPGKVPRLVHRTSSGQIKISAVGEHPKSFQRSSSHAVMKTLDVPRR